jgi:5-formyltetrahydrofolate cyclo-ligase
MDIALRKQLLRRETIGRILAVDPARRAFEEAALLERFAALPGFEAAGCVLLYASAFAEEFPTAPLLRIALGRGKRVACPRVDRSKAILQLHEVRDLDADFRRGTLGIPEPRRRLPEIDPAEIDWALVPGLAFDARGYRLGRGAGHYDRLLPRLRPETPCWALALDEQWVDVLPVEPHDVPLDGVVSPSRAVVPVSCGAARPPGAEHTP